MLRLTGLLPLCLMLSALPGCGAHAPSGQKPVYITRLVEVRPQMTERLSAEPEPCPPAAPSTNGEDFAADGACEAHADMLRQWVKDLQALILGPVSEEP